MTTKTKTKTKTTRRARNLGIKAASHVRGGVKSGVRAGGRTNNEDKIAP